jgi:hypothetical protein
MSMRNAMPDRDRHLTARVPGLALLDLSRVEQRYRAVLAVLAGDRVGEVAAKFKVS